MSGIPSLHYRCPDSSCGLGAAGSVCICSRNPQSFFHYGDEAGHPPYPYIITTADMAKRVEEFLRLGPTTDDEDRLV